MCPLYKSEIVPTSYEVTFLQQPLAIFGGPMPLHYSPRVNEETDLP